MSRTIICRSPQRTYNICLRVLLCCWSTCVAPLFVFQHLLKQSTFLFHWSVHSAVRVLKGYSGPYTHSQFYTCRFTYLGFFFFFHLRVGPVLIILYIVHGADRNASVSRSSISRFSQGIKNDSISLWVVQSDMGEKCIMISVFHISRSLSLSLALSSIILYMYTVFLYSQQKVSDNKAN